VFLLPHPFQLKSSPYLYANVCRRLPGCALPAACVCVCMCVSVCVCVCVALFLAGGFQHVRVWFCVFCRWCSWILLISDQLTDLVQTGLPFHSCLPVSLCPCGFGLCVCVCVSTLRQLLCCSVCPVYTRICMSASTYALVWRVVESLRFTVCCSKGCAGGQFNAAALRFVWPSNGTRKGQSMAQLSSFAARGVPFCM